VAAEEEEASRDQSPSDDDRPACALARDEAARWKAPEGDSALLSTVQHSSRAEGQATVPVCM
jgi:hypothetical protein